MGLTREVAAALRASVASTNHGRQPSTNESATSEPRPLNGICAGAAFHGIVGYVHRLYRDDDRLPEQERAGLKLLRDRAVLAHMRTVADLRFLQRTLAGANVPYLVIKGPTLAQAVHGAVDLRSYGDLDAVVPPEALPAALDALEAAGAVGVDRNWTMLLREMGGEVHMRLPSGTPLDLHWHLLNERHCRRAFSIDMDGAFRRSVMVEVDGLDVPTLGPADTVVYVSLHTLLSGGHRLIWLKDLERLLAVGRTPLGDIREVAHQWDASLAVTTAVSRTIGALGPAPHLQGPARFANRSLAWRTLTSAAWRLDPAERQDGSGSLGRIVSRATRSNQRQSLMELLRRSRRHLKDRGRVDPDGGRHQPTDPRSYLYDSGGERARRAYLEAVVSHGQHDRTK